MPGSQPPGAIGDIAAGVLAILLEHGEATRKTIASGLSISLPTVTNVLSDLEGRGFVRELRREQGPRGRATLVYGLADTAGWVIGVDVGSTQVSVLAQHLDGTVLTRLEHGVETGDPVGASLAAGALVATLFESERGRGQPVAVGVGVNQVVPKSFTPSAPGGTTATMISALAGEAGLPDTVPVVVENNVNCAAVAEHEDGDLRGIDDGGYLQIGVGLGFGFFADGALIRGGNGASGELAQIPLSWDGGVDSPRNAIEHTYGSHGLLAAVRSVWPDGDEPPASSEQVFALAAEGNVAAGEIMRRHATAIARIAAAVATVLDPSVLVIGGGLSRDATFVDLVADEFLSRIPRTELRTSRKGTAATVQGAAFLARDHASSILLGGAYRRILSRPALWSPAESAGEVVA
ncbi:ROK family transcriptional regulator [Labedella phragmitis]|uniref:ROK family transcriptional regulator n=1 Tax=Labedella phragmitis TaxID=2498849 RepID=A0A3S4AE57_9MICO|nr:ROK family transcriptional regulator [Labedella phragmitis]RWZ46299.1 ROK family transcriptional regulator [Labedella phragmitis]